VHLLETFIRNLIEYARYRKPQVYSTTVMASSEFIEPQTQYNKQIHYPQLYEELKSLILI
jgi:hypothetical protein